MKSAVEKAKTVILELGSDTAAEEYTCDDGVYIDSEGVVFFIVPNGAPEPMSDLALVAFAAWLEVA